MMISIARLLTWWALASAAQAWDVFLAACDEAPPDPAGLGLWFAEFRLTGVDILDMSITGDQR